MVKTIQQMIEDYKGLPAKDQEEVSRIMEEKKKLVDADKDAKVNAQSVVPLPFEEILSPDRDRAERVGFARSVSDFIAKSKNYNTFSINGSWGSGKTVFLGWVAEALKNRDADRVIVIPFQAWRSEVTGNLVLSLLLELRKLSPGRDFQKKIDHHLNKVIAAAGLIYGVHYFIPLLGIKNTLSLLSTTIKDYFGYKDLSEKKAKAQMELQSDFKDAVAYIIGSYQGLKYQKIVFLIDELDRCSPLNVLRLLESVKNFLQIEKTCFVFSIDKDIIARAIEANYPTLSSFDAEEYLEKIIQFSYELSFNYALVWDGLLKDAVADFEFLQKADLKFFAGIFEMAEINSIRKMKRVINRFCIVNGELTRIGANLDAQALLLVVFLYETYPRVYTMLRENRRIPLLDHLATLQPQTEDQLAKQIQPYQSLDRLVQGTKVVQVIAEFKRLTGPQSPNRPIAPIVTECFEQIVRVGG